MSTSRESRLHGSRGRSAIPLLSAVWALLAVVLLLLVGGVLIAAVRGESFHLARLDRPQAKLLMAAIFGILGSLLIRVGWEIGSGYGRRDWDIGERYTTPIVFAAALFIVEGAVFFVWFLLEGLFHISPTPLFSYPGRSFLFVAAACIPFLPFFPMQIGIETSRMVATRIYSVRDQAGGLFGFVYVFGAMAFIGPLILIGLLALVKC